ncbi:hypothetical protein BpHYR1_014838 [Brachionus plicatilis]|uniref:Uncharacterized protein n=1 Tax=Brachionus plicatilis TaxID=10195 RepID=A0A3M7QJ22_BRAPC|nr:hypothetical protein BpHYR1_014838 [Brachionus plicatilis]
MELLGMRDFIKSIQFQVLTSLINSKRVPSGVCPLFTLHVKKRLTNIDQFFHTLDSISSLEKTD